MKSKFLSLGLVVIAALIADSIEARGDQICSESECGADGTIRPIAPPPRGRQIDDGMGGRKFCDPDQHCYGEYGWQQSYGGFALGVGTAQGLGRDFSQFLGSVIGEVAIRGAEKEGSVGYSAELRAHLGAGEVPFFDIRGSASFGFYAIAGTWVAIEAGRFSDLTAKLIQWGLMPVHFTVHLGERDYVMVRLGIGLEWGEVTGEGLRKKDWYGGTLIAHAAFLIRLDGKELSLEGTYNVADFQSEAGVFQDSKRARTFSGVTRIHATYRIPLNLIDRDNDKSDGVLIDAHLRDFDGEELNRTDLMVNVGYYVRF